MLPLALGGILAALVGVENAGSPAIPQRVLQRAERERDRMHRQHPQAHHGPGEEVHDGGEVQPAPPVAEVGEVGSPGRILSFRETPP